MKESSDGFVRADQIDLKSLDEQLERHLNRVLTLEKTKMRDQDTNSTNNNLNSLNLSTTTTAAAAAATSTSGMTLAIPKRHRQEWEIDPSKLIIKTVIARGTFGTVHRGVYDGQDVAGMSFYLFFFMGPFQVVQFFIFFVVFTPSFVLKIPIFFGLFTSILCFYQYPFHLDFDLTSFYR